MAGRLQIEIQKLKTQIEKDCDGCVIRNICGPNEIQGKAHVELEYRRLRTQLFDDLLHACPNFTIHDTYDFRDIDMLQNSADDLKLAFKKVRAIRSKFARDYKALQNKAIRLAAEYEQRRQQEELERQLAMQQQELRRQQEAERQRIERERAKRESQSAPMPPEKDEGGGWFSWEGLAKVIGIAGALYAEKEGFSHGLPDVTSQANSLAGNNSGSAACQNAMVRLDQRGQATYNSCTGARNVLSELPKVRQLCAGHQAGQNWLNQVESWARQTLQSNCN